MIIGVFSLDHVIIWCFLSGSCDPLYRQQSPTPISSSSQTPSTAAAPPPRPPKKAELAGNPLNPPPQSGRDQISPSPPPDQRPETTPPPSLNPLNQFGDRRGLISANPDPPSGPTTPPPVPPGQSLEEQLQELQKQQHMQLQSLKQSVLDSEDVSSPQQQPVDGGVSANPMQPLLSHFQPAQGDPSPHSATPPVGQPSATLSLGFLPADGAGDQAAGGGGGGGDGSIVGGTHSETNQALLDLQLLLQPSSELDTPLQPGSESKEGAGFTMSLQPSVLDHRSEPVMGIRPLKPVHLQSQSVLPLDANPLVGSGDADLPPPMEPTPPSQLSPQQLSSLEGGIGGAPPHHLSENQPPTSISALPQGEDFAQTPRRSSVVLSGTFSAPQFSALMSGELFPEGGRDPAVNFPPPVSSSPAGGFNDNTMTITSISRPIPTPVLSPPMSPNQNQTLDSLEPEQDVESSVGTVLALPPGGVSDGVNSLYSRQNLQVASEVDEGLGSEQVDPLPASEPENQNETVESLSLVSSQSDLHSTLDSRIGSSTSLTADQVQSSVPLDITSLALQNFAAISPAVVSASIPSTLEFSHGLDTDLHALPQLSETSFHSIPVIGSSSLHTPPSMSPLSLDMGSRLGQAASNPIDHLQSLMASNRTLQQSVEEKNREIEQHKASIADQRTQLDNYKQQLLVLQQQVSHVSLQQQKQEQEKATASGQQAVLMQLLQQQQGMFSQQQAQIEKLSKVGDSHRKEVMEMEVKYKQALAVEQEKNSTLAGKITQQNLEMQRLHQQLQAGSQQQQMAQVHLYQYQTQIQERDKQLLAFRNQHKEIIQNLEQKYQQKVSQLVQQIQELQGEVKKAKSHQRQGPPLQPTAAKTPPHPPRLPAQQFSQAPRPSQQQFVSSQTPSTPMNNPQARQILVPSTTAPSAVAAATAIPSHLAQSQIPPALQPQAFQSHGPRGIFGQSSPSNPTNPQQMQNPLSPRPPGPPGAMLPQVAPPQASGGVKRNLLNRQPDNQGRAQAVDVGPQHSNFYLDPPRSRQYLSLLVR